MKKIMIVDDNALSVEGIEKNIDWAALGTQVTHIKYDGGSAIEAMKQEPPTLSFPILKCRIWTASP